MLSLAGFAGVIMLGRSLCILLTSIGACAKKDSNPFDTAAGVQH